MLFKMLSAIPIVWLLLQTTSISQESQQGGTVRVASISFEPVKFDLDANRKSLDSWFRKAAAGGAKIAVAPEGALEGYVVNVIIAGDANAERMKDLAVSIDSPTIKQFQALARELDLCLVFGFAEKIRSDVFNCAVFIDNDGQIRGKYHKMQLAEGYDERWWFNRLGKQSRAFDTPYGRCGVLICNDRWNPLLAKIPALDGAQFLVIPSFGTTHTSQDEAVLARGVENGLPIVEANVGVSLIVSDNRIVAVDRHREGITFGQIRIPAEKVIDQVARDRVEQEFFQWRENEMPVRLAETKQKIEASKVRSAVQ
jgi:predicted amidohydrolase